MNLDSNAVSPIASIAPNDHLEEFARFVRAVIAESFERIHRSNLVGMGVLPLQFREGENVQSLDLTGEEQFSIELSDDLQAGSQLQVRAVRPNGEKVSFSTTCRLDTAVDLIYYRHGGILHTVLRNFMRG